MYLWQLPNIHIHKGPLQLWVCVGGKDTLNSTHIPYGCQDVLRGIRMWTNDRHQSLSSYRAWKQWFLGSFLCNYSPYTECPAVFRGVSRVDTGERKIRETSSLALVMPPTPEITTRNLWNKNILSGIVIIIYFNLYTLSLKIKEKMFGSLLPCCY